MARTIPSTTKEGAPCWRVLPNRYPRELGIVVPQPDGSWLAIRPDGTTHRHTSRSSAVHRLCLEAAKHGA